MARKCPELKEKAKLNRQSKDKRSLRTMAKLKDALFELMQETPLEDLSIQDICAKARIHRTTFYLKFKDKSSLFTECIYFVKRELEAKISEKIKDLDNPVDFCNVVLDEVLTYTEDNKAFIRNILDKKF